MRIMLAITLLAGCVAPVKQTSATTPRTASAPDSDDDNEECRDEAPTGSLMIRTYCRDKTEREGNRKEAQEFLEKPRSAPSSVH